MSTAEADGPAKELHLGGGGLWAPVVPVPGKPEQWMCQADEDDAPAVVRSVD